MQEYPWFEIRQIVYFSRGQLNKQLLRSGVCMCTL